MPAKLTIQQARECFKKVNLELLEDEYINNTIPMKCRCPKHPDKILYMSLRVVRRGCGCKYCGWEKGHDKLREDIDTTRNLFSSRGYELLSDSRTNSHEKLRYRCPKHPDKELFISLASLKRGAGCPYCSGVAKPTYEEVKKLFEERGYVLLSREYVNSHAPLKYMCPRHPDKDNAISYTNLKSGKGCPYCAGNCIKYSYEQVRSFFQERGYELLSTEYIGVRHKLEYRCPKHPDKVNKVTLTNLLSHDRGCPHCAQSKGEKTIAEYLSKMGVEFECEYKFPDCRNKLPLPFDFAIFKNGKLVGLIEYDGIQHFEPVSAFGGKRAFNATRKHDEIKNEYCKRKGIPLYRISYKDDVIEKLKALPILNA